MKAQSLDLTTLRAAYLSGSITPGALVADIIRRTASDPNNVWIHRLPDAAILAYAKALEGKDLATLPLYGIPFAIKDNIDLAGVPTTAGCREYTYTSQKSAFVVQCLIDAGAIPIGKTNLDQFATGLNGTRSPFGACRNSFDPDYISGGSSSGSAVAVALGYCSFSLGTDTAGSGRVPAAFNNIVGHKPTLGWLSTSGMVPACRTLDAMSIFAQTAQDIETVMAVAAKFDGEDYFAREAQGHGFDFGSAPSFKIGIPRIDQLEFLGNPESAHLFAEAVARVAKIGGECIEIDLQPFLDTAQLLYGGTWVAERHAAIKDFLAVHPDALLPVIRSIIDMANNWSATDAYVYGYKIKKAKRECDAVWQQVDCILTPTAGTIYRIADMEADPIRLNNNLGIYTNFMNLLDYAATAVPAGFQDNGLPFGVTVFAPAYQDAPLLRLGARLHRAADTGTGAARLPLNDAVPALRLPNGQIRVAVCGAHLSGLPLNWQLASRGGRLVSTVLSAPEYKFYALPGGPPFRPGMVRVHEDGGAIEMEIWELPAREFGSFVAGIPAPLGIGMVKLQDGSSVQGFTCEATAATGAEDITRLGSWRRYLEAKRAAITTP